MRILLRVNVLGTNNRLLGFNTVMLIRTQWPDKNPLNRVLGMVEVDWTWARLLLEHVGVQGLYGRVGVVQVDGLADIG